MKFKLLLCFSLILLGGFSHCPQTANMVYAGNALNGTGLAQITANLNNNTIAAYHKLEFHLTIHGSFENPYDPDEIAVDAVFTGPDQQESKVPGFYYQAFAREIKQGREILTKKGVPDWCIRFTPDQPGDWSCRFIITCRGKVTESEQVAFKVIPDNHHGFIRADPNHSGYFVFDDGSIFLPIGSNVAWYDDRGMVAYDTWFAKMAKNGANFARIWLATWGFAPEWYDTGLGNYDARQDRAWQLDYLFELAEQKNIYLMLCFLNHGQFSTGTDPEWDKNPYNIANGGFLKEPSEFYSNPSARKLKL